MPGDERYLLRALPHQKSLPPYQNPQQTSHLLLGEREMVGYPLVAFATALELWLHPGWEGGGMDYWRHLRLGM